MSTPVRYLSSSLQRASKSLHSLSKTRQLPASCLQTASRTQFQSSVLSNLRVSALPAQRFVRNYVTAQEQPPKTPESASGPIGGPGAPRPPKDNKLKAWPFILIFVVGAVTFAYVVDNKDSNKQKAMPAVGSSSASKGLPKLRDDGPIFNPKDVKVIFVLGGPGVGKGTQCAKLVKDYNFVHLSAGDLLREEQSREGTDYGELIKSYIKDGKIVPMEVTIVLLENAMKRNIADGKKSFLIDGFPRQMDQALKFEEVVVPSQFTLFFDTDEDTLTKRLLERGKTSGRSDDNPESILKRFRTFKETSMPVVNYFDGQKKVVKVDGGKSIDAVYKDVVAHIANRLK
ncbi:hypothetical protein TWF694_011130 [Orbilia ellipsospora]|uniref:Uridylate kinase n=1 Tax=Orbilia ellipsospora TaxID=2528407 RepID=A0AAV9X9G2_9PEZI